MTKKYRSERKGRRRRDTAVEYYTKGLNTTVARTPAFGVRGFSLAMHSAFWVDPRRWVAPQRTSGPPYLCQRKKTRAQRRAADPAQSGTVRATTCGIGWPEKAADPKTGGPRYDVRNRMAGKKPRTAKPAVRATAAFKFEPSGLQAFGLCQWLGHNGAFALAHSPRNTRARWTMANPADGTPAPLGPGSCECTRPSRCTPRRCARRGRKSAVAKVRMPHHAAC